MARTRRIKKKNEVRLGAWHLGFSEWDEVDFPSGMCARFLKWYNTSLMKAYCKDKVAVVTGAGGTLCSAIANWTMFFAQCMASI